MGQFYTDGDYVSDGAEYDHGTNPEDEDTDNDGLSDRQEIYYYGTYGYTWDSDEDRMSDKEEVDIYHTDPLVRNDRYAVLIAGGWNKYENYAWFWNSLMFMYDILVDKYRYFQENVYVLYADGNLPSNRNCYDPEHVIYHPNVIDFAATKLNLQTVFSQLASRMDKNDFLFIYITDHGDTDSTYSYICLWNEKKIKDSEFAGNDYLGRITSYDHMVIVLGQCFGGGFLDDLAKVDRVVVSASRDTEKAYICDNHPSEEGYYAEFLYQLMIAVNGAKPDETKVNADRDGNGYISMKEAYLYAFSHDSYNPDGDLYVQHDSNGDGRADDEMQEHPQICEFFNLAERCYL